MFLALTIVAVLVAGMCGIVAIFSLVALGFRHIAKKIGPDKSKHEGEMLTVPEEKIFRTYHCPDCGAELLVGPQGGMSVNYKCARSQCGSRFNFIGPFGVERITNASPEKRVTLPQMHNDGPFRS